MSNNLTFDMATNTETVVINYNSFGVSGFTSVGYAAPSGISYEEWIRAGEAIRRIDRFKNFAIGDWLLTGEQKFGEMYSQAMDDFEWGSYDKVTKLVWVARKVPPENRRTDLTWTHHHHVAGLLPCEQKEWLQYAAEYKLSGEELRESIKNSKQIAGPEITALENQPEKLPAIEREKIFTVTDEHGIEETIVVQPGEVLKVIPIEVAENLAYFEDSLVDKPHVAQNSGNNEWYTPSEFIDAARSVMGDIDLDPASSHIANGTVQAKGYFTKDDDGLSLPWYGRVWMNPPYAADLIAKFTEKLASHVVAGDVQEAIVLVNNATETAWFQDLIDVAAAVAFPQSRVKFYKPDGTHGAPLQGQAIIYMGNQPDLFRETFSTFGWSAKL